jgi:ankyrin repeat protein
LHFLDDKMNTLLKAIYANDKKLIDILWKELSTQYSNEYLSNLCLNRAVAGNHTGLVIELLGMGADVNYINIDAELHCCAYTPLMVAASHNNVDMLKLLIQNGANPKLEFSDGCAWCTALCIAAEDESADAFQYLLEFYDKNTSFINDYFKRAISISDVKFSPVEQLVIGGCNVNTKFQGGGTPLIEAVKSGFITTVEFFIASGADVNLSDDRGLTPLLWATYYDLQEIIDFLTPLSNSETIRLVKTQLSDRESIEKLLFT